MKLYFVFFNKNSDVTNESKKGNLLFKKIKILSINMHVAGLSAELIIEAPSQ